MATIDDLEAQLREGLDRGIDPDVIVVYADQLQATGDPRGELIVIDLEIEQSGPNPALAQRRRELVDTWLGTQRPNGTIRCGFIDLDATSADPVEQIRVAFGGKAARFVRSVTAVGPPKMLKDTVAAIAEAPRPFLSRVTLRQWSERERATLDAGLAASFARATPNLQALELDARHLFEDLAHPSIRRLRISGWDAIESLPTGALALPALVELDLAMQCHLATLKSGPPDTLFERLGKQLPELVTLDLSRNEHGFLDPHTLGGEIDIFVWLAKLACRARLLSLTLSPLTTPHAIGNVRAAVAAMTSLRDLAIVRTKSSEHALLTRNFTRPDLTLRIT